MKKYFLIFPCVIILFSCGSKGKSKTDNTTDSTQVSTQSFFGDTISDEGAIDGANLISMMRNQDSANVKVKAKISEVCQKKGCWMDVELAEGKLMTVRFKDYGFFVPKDAGGKETVIEGTVRREIQTVEWLKHKAEDAGKTKEEIDAITQPDTSLSFEAFGVIIK